MSTKKQEEVGLVYPFIQLIMHGLYEVIIPTYSYVGKYHKCFECLISYVFLSLAAVRRGWAVVVPVTVGACSWREDGDPGLNFVQETRIHGELVIIDVNLVPRKVKETFNLTSRLSNIFTAVANYAL